MAITADDYIGDCYICGCSIFRRHSSPSIPSNERSEDEHYVLVLKPDLREDHPNGLVRCTTCAPGTPSWMDSPIGQVSKYREYFEQGKVEAQERRQTVTAQRKARADVASPLLKSFTGRIKYFVHMLKVSKDVIPWKLELVDGDLYYEAEFDGETLRIEAHGAEVAFEPKDTLLDRIREATL